MTDTNVAESATVETTTTAPEAVFSSPETGAADQSPERDYEAEARDMGWFPEAEFKGKKRPAEFLDAKTFVERGEHVLPILKREREKLEKEYEGRFAKLEKVSAKTIDKLIADHEREIAGLNAAKDAAIEAGNVAEVRKIDGQIAKAEANAPEKDAPAPTEDVEAVTAAWQKDNKWYETDDELTEAAIGISQNILRKNPDITMAENLRQTTEKMRERFPLKLGAKSGAHGHAPVDGGSSLGGTGAKDPLANLPAEARAQAKSDMARLPKIYPNAAAWLKVYNS